MDRMSTVYLALGSNLGDRPANLRAAIAALPPDVDVTAESPVYETPPWGYADQPAFLNQVVEARTRLDPPGLLAHLKRVEKAIGRRPSFRYGPRRIDLDILFYDDLQYDRDGLVIPHPRLHERAFVLVPLADIVPGLVHPVLDLTVRQLLALVDRQGITLWSE